MERQVQLKGQGLCPAMERPEPKNREGKGDLGLWPGKQPSIPHKGPQSPVGICLQGNHQLRQQEKALLGGAGQSSSRPFAALLAGRRGLDVPEGSGEGQASRPPYLSGTRCSCRQKLYPSIHPSAGWPAGPRRVQLRPTVLQLAALVAGGDVKRATEELLRVAKGAGPPGWGGGEKEGAVRAEGRAWSRFPTQQKGQRRFLPPPSPPRRRPSPESSQPGPVWHPGIPVARL